MWNPIKLKVYFPFLRKFNWNNQHEKTPLFAYGFFHMQLHLQLPFLFNCSHKTLRDAESRSKQVFRCFSFAFIFSLCNQQMCAWKLILSNAWIVLLNDFMKQDFNYNRTCVDEIHVSNRAREVSGKSYVAVIFSVSTHHKRFITEYCLTSDWFYDFSMLILIASAIKITFIINY